MPADLPQSADYGDDVDVAEPMPDTIGHASQTAKCHHCEERIYRDYSGEWTHVATGRAPCKPLPPNGSLSGGEDGR